jgi:putative ABC transport system permease protein
MRRIFANLHSSITSLREQKSRAALSALGIMVGSLAILLLVSIAKGVQADVGREVQGLGVNLLIVIPGRIEDDSLFAPGLLGISHLEEGDVARIQGVEGVRRAVPVAFVGSGVSLGETRSPATLVVGTRPDWFAIRNSKFRSGRPFDAREGLQRVCVLGSVAAKRIFGDEEPTGKAVKIGEASYEVVGVTEDAQSSNSLFSQGSFENMAFVPFDLVQSEQERAQINRIFIQTEPDREPKSLLAAVDRVLGERLARDMYSVLTQEDLLQLVFKVMSILTSLLTGLTSIALFVGGVGIMTVMLMSVHERAKEIGIRKTVGARRADIFVQFLGEAVAVSVVGGLAGLALSVIAAQAISQFTVIKPLLTADVVGLALGVCVAVGTLFGLWPAMRAAAKDPVESLRHE